MKNTHILLKTLPTPGLLFPKGFQQVYLNVPAENDGINPLSRNEKVLVWVKRVFGTQVEKRLIKASVSKRSEHLRTVLPYLGYRSVCQLIALDEGVLLTVLKDRVAERAELSLQPILNALGIPALLVDFEHTVLLSNTAAITHQLVSRSKTAGGHGFTMCEELKEALCRQTLTQPSRAEFRIIRQAYCIESHPIVDTDLRHRYALIKCIPKQKRDWGHFQTERLPSLLRGQLMQQFSGCYAAFRRNGVLLEVNDNCREMMKQLVIANPLDALKLQAEDWQELEGSGSITTELRLGLQVYSIEMFLVHNDDLEDVVILLGANISHRALIERETQAYLALFRELFNSADDGLAVITADDAIVREGNERFAELAGLPFSRLSGHSLDSCKYLDVGLVREQIAIAKELGSKTLELQAGVDHEMYNLNVTYFDSADCFLIRLSELSAQLLAASQRREQLQIEASAAIQAQEAERQRIAADLHDSLGQVLSVADMQLTQLLQRVNEPTFSQLDQIQKLVTMATEEVRLISANLVPTTLKDFGLPQALEELVEHIHTDEQPVIYRLQGEVTRFDRDTETALFRIAQEALQNAVKHSCATQIYILLDYSETDFRLMVYDNGRGFSPEEDTSGRGLNNMRARASLVNAELRFESEPGEGSRVMVQLQRVA